MRRAAHGPGAGVGLRLGAAAGRVDSGWLPALSSAARLAAALGVAGLSLAALIVAGCGAGSHTQRPPPHVHAQAPIVAPPRPPAESPGQLRLDAALRRGLDLAGPGSEAAVYDLTAHKSLFALRDAVQGPPASVEKLYTSVALLRKLGPDARLRTTVRGTGHLGSDGIWNGDLYLRGGGDPTLGDGAFNRSFELGYGPTALELVQQLTSDGIRSVTGSVIGDASLFDARRGSSAGGYAPDIPDFGGELAGLTYDHGSTGKLSPGAFAARALARTLRGAHVPATAATATATAPAGARTLAAVKSPPLSVMLGLMDVPSDDFIAEMLTKQLGVRFAGQGTIDAGARVIAKVINGFNLHPVILDGSGLVRADRSSPREVVDLLRDVWHTPDGDVLSASLPVLGVSGTVRRIALGTPAEGNCVAKTGTLDNVTNLAGYCHRRSHHALAFALFAAGPSNTRALMLEGQMIAAIARF